MQIHFILVRPVVPENIGFVCRSIKNMGFDKLRIVDSDKYLKKGARNTAYESHEVLENIQYFDDLESAIQDMDMVIGTTAKNRKLRYEYVDSQNIRQFLDDRRDSFDNLAIVFGSESDGLNSTEEKCCDVLSTISMAEDYPSINLSHSVMIYAYELSGLNKVVTKQTNDVSNDLYSAFKGQVEEFLSILEVDERQPGIYQQVKDKLLLLPENDIKLFMSLARYLRNHIK